MKVITKRAIEVIDVSQSRGLEGVYREYRIMNQLARHPNVVQCLGMLHSTNYLYFVKDYLPGARTLAGVLHKIEASCGGMHGAAMSQKQVQDVFGALVS